MEEIFKDIPGYKGYQVSNKGNVRSVKRIEARILRPCNSKKRNIPPSVVLFNNGKARPFYVPRLVWSAFMEWPQNPDICYINHKDGNLRNCNLENLECLLCEITEDYDPHNRHHKGCRIPAITRERMSEAKLHQSPESIEKGRQTRMKTCKLRRERMKELEEENKRLKELVKNMG